MYQLIVKLLSPFTLLCLATLAAIIILWLRGRAGRSLLLWLTVPFVLLMVMCMPLTAYLARGTLEWTYSPGVERTENVQAIVVLAGYVRAPDKVQTEPLLGEDTFLRCMHAAKLYRQGKPCPVFVSGGKVDPKTTDATLAGLMADFLQTLGVAPEDIVKEEKSTTTYENARFTAPLLSERGIERFVLVTSAYHMRRSEGCFRAQGFQPLPSACDFRATEFRRRPIDFLPDPNSAGDLQLAGHEWLGMIWYWFWGRI
jgi:uncharacterized SAM-binding protein YcdF (DUF218 family)